MPRHRGNASRPLLNGSIVVQTGAQMASELLLAPAEKRVDRVTFNPRTEWHDHRIEVGTYVCPACETTIQFNTGTLRQFETARTSPLGDEWARRCNSVRPLGAYEFAADFRCGGCPRAVRMVYGHDGEVAMGTPKYRVLHFIEEREAG
jgi:hypothetical protein